MKKEAGKVTGYIYTAKNKKTGKDIVTDKEVEDITKGIDIKTDGEFEIEIRAIDEAENKSDTKTVNVYKDETPPEIRNAGGKGYNVNWIHSSYRRKRRYIRNSKI